MKSATARVLQIPKPPPDRGSLLTVDEVRAIVGDQVSRIWVYRHVPHRVKLSYRVVRWYEADVRAWLEGLRDAS